MDPLDVVVEDVVVDSDLLPVEAEGVVVLAVVLPVADVAAEGKHVLTHT